MIFNVEKVKARSFISCKDDWVFFNDGIYAHKKLTNCQNLKYINNRKNCDINVVQIKTCSSDLKIVFQLVAFENSSKNNIYRGKRETEEKHKNLLLKTDCFNY